MSEKFQLVLDVAQKAQVLRWVPAPSIGQDSPDGWGGSWFSLTMVPGGWRHSQPGGRSQLLGEAQNWVHCHYQRVNLRFRPDLSPILSLGRRAGPQDIWCRVVVSRGTHVSGQPGNLNLGPPSSAVWTDSPGSVVTAVASPHRTSLARWPTSWKRSRSKSWSPLATPGGGPAPRAWGWPRAQLSSRLPSSLFMWVQPEITQKLYVALWAAFLASCFFPYRLVGLALGEQTRVGRCGMGSGRPLLPTGTLPRHCSLQDGPLRTR